MRKSLLILLLLVSAIVQGAESPKYVFLFIGDGFGDGYGDFASAVRPDLPKPIFLDFKVQATTETDNAQKKTTDSAAAGTALACGVKTTNGFLGVTPEKGCKSSIAVRAKQEGRLVGLIASIGLNHATPAAFYAHVDSRTKYGQIALELPWTGFDYLGGEPLIGSPLERDVADGMFQKAGYLLAKGDSLFKAQRANLLPCYVAGTESDALSQKKTDGAIPIASHLEWALKLFGDAPFFIMVEGSKIDHAAHANNAKLMVAEIFDFDAAVRVAVDFMKKHPADTLIVVTADHNTGGLLWKSDGKGDTALVKHFAAPGSWPDQLKAFHAGAFVETIQPDGKKIKSPKPLAELQDLAFSLLECKEKIKLTPSEAAAFEKLHAAKQFNAGAFLKLAASVQEARVGFTWSGGGHFSTPIRTFAEGIGAESFAGENRPNTDIPRTLHKLMFKTELNP